MLAYKRPDRKVRAATEVENLENFGVNGPGVALDCGRTRKGGKTMSQHDTVASDRDFEMDDLVTRTMQANWLFARLPPWVVDTMTTEQKEAIHNAITDNVGNIPPVNIRMHMPFFSRRFYLTVLAGEEKRSEARRHHERQKYPLRTIANVFFFIGLATLFYMVALVGLALHSAILEF